MSDQSDKTDPTHRFDEDIVVGGDRPLSIPGDLPVLPLRDTVLFPNSFMPLAVAREASVRLIDEATTSGRMIGVFTQREASVEEPLVRRTSTRSAPRPTSTRCSSCRTAACG